MPAIAIVDDHELLAESLRISFAAAGIEAQRFAPSDLDTLLPVLLETHPALVLLDLDLGTFGESTPLIAPLVAAGIRVLLVTGVVDRTRIAAALEQGATGYQPKSAGFEALVAKARAALTSELPLDPVERLQLLDELARARANRARAHAPFERLTEREQETLRALAHGASVQQIARAWVVSEATIRSHVRAVLTKLGVNSQLGAVAMATDADWLR